MSSRIHPHSPLPAPALHATHVAQSKSHVLAGVQDAYWSDDEAEDADCPLCLEEMDISDLNFKPCPCGYQICRFCWHHIKENLNGRCPACRREYTDEAVQFKPINKEDHKRLTQQKKQRERERKELDALNRRHLANVRVVQRNVVYVIGLGPRFAKEELIPTLRSNEYFGQYGKISKIVIVKRTPPGGRAPVIGLYITYNRREDAARAISAVDGAPSPGGGSDIMRASYGTTKYCMAFLRGVSCTDHSCMNLHEWGDEKDCFTKEDLTTLKHTMKDTETRSRTTTVRKDDESEGLPRGASWASKPITIASSTLQNYTNATNQSAAAARQTRRSATSTRQQRTGSATVATTIAEVRGAARDRKSGTTGAKAPSQASSSRPATPATTQQNRPVTPASAKTVKHKEQVPSPPQPAPRSPTSSVAIESDIGSSAHEAEPTASPLRLLAKVAPAVPPGIPVGPPGLSAPPGLPPPSRPPTGVPQVPTQPPQSAYQMSTQAQALMEDIKARRELPPATVTQSPFPDFDRMLQTLSGADGEYGGFSFNLDTTLASQLSPDITLPDLEAEANVPFSGTFFDAFPALRSGGPSAANPLIPPPGLSYPQPLHRSVYDPFTAGGRPSAMERQSSGSSGYTGSFNPFASENNDEAPSQRFSPFDEERKVSRFGFARGRQGSTSSSLHAPSPLGNPDNASHSSFYHSELPSPVGRVPPAWPFQSRHQAHEYTHPHHQSGSALSSPLAQHAQAQSTFAHQQQQSRFQQYEAGVVSEAQLRDLINSSANLRNGSTDQPTYNYGPNQPFHDPAIMSARLASPTVARSVQDPYSNPPSAVDSLSSHHLAYGPPPGLQFPDGSVTQAEYATASGPSTNVEVSQSGSAQVSTSTSLVPSPALSSSDFPALSAAEPSARREQQQPDPAPASDIPVVDKEAEAKAERKAAKKAAAAERAAERARVAQEKAAAKAAEKERIAQEKAAEKERAAALKAEKERVAKDKAEKEKAERLEKERAEKEKAEQEKAERERAEIERAAKEAKEKAEKDQVDQARKGGAAKATKVAAAAKTVKPAESIPSTPPPGTSNLALEKTPTQSDVRAQRRAQAAKAAPIPIPPPEPVAQVPILSKMPKKNKPNAKPIRIPKEEPVADATSSLASAANSDAPQLPDAHTRENSSNNSRAGSVDRTLPSQPTPLETLVAEIDMQLPWMEVAKNPLFDMQKLNPVAKVSLEYGPLVHALSALSVGGGSFANNMPSGSIDNAVSSFQQLLETLTQTISDLLRLLPRKTWDDNSSFDGVLRDMLKGDDFLDDGGDDQNGQGKDDEVAVLTLALERRARWMEVQLSKLEELHRDINTAAVRAVLSFNDNGWDVHGFLPRVGNTLQRFDQIGLVSKDGVYRAMTADELDKRLAVAKEAAAFADAELREVMQRTQALKPTENGDY